MERQVHEEVETPRKRKQHETREKQERKRVWRPPALLPEYEIPGYHLAWIRYTLRGEDEKDHVFRKIQEGYEPVRPEEVGAVGVPTMEDGKYAGAITSGDVMLMKLPLEMWEQRQEHFQELTRRQEQASEQQFYSGAQPGMPVHRSVENRTSVGRPSFRED